MPITNASRLADFASGASPTNTSVIQVDYTNQRVGIGTTNPKSTLNVIGIVSATAFFGSGANLTGVISGIEIKSSGASVGTAITNLNFIGATATSSGAASTITIAPSFNELDAALFS